MHADYSDAPDRSPALLAACLAALCALGGVSLSTSPLAATSTGLGAGLPRPAALGALLSEVLHPEGAASVGTSLAPGCLKLVPDGPAMHDQRVPVAQLRAAYPKAPLTFTEQAIGDGGAYSLAAVLLCPW